MDIGGMRIENVPVYIRKFFDNNVPVDGYLGLSVVSKFLTSIDYGTRRMSLVRQNQTEMVEPWTVRRPEGMQALVPITASDGVVEVPLRTTSSGFLSGEVGLEGFDKTVNFIIDTAASITVVSEKLSQEEQLLELLQPSRMRVFGAAGVTEDVKLLQLPRLSLGLTTPSNASMPRCWIWNPSTKPRVSPKAEYSAETLRHFRIYFDSRAARCGSSR